MTDAPRWWVEGLRAALADGTADAAAAAESFAARIPGGYAERTDPAVAAADLRELAALDGPGGADQERMTVQADPDPGAGMFRLRLYGRRAVELSSFLPILESFGLSVVEAIPNHIAAPGGGKALHLDDFGLRARGRTPFDPAAGGPRLVAAVAAGWRGDTEVDSLNRLVVRAGLDWWDVAVLRAYRRYRRQVGTPWSDRQLDDPLVEFPAVAVALLRYYAARFDPAGGPPAAAAREVVVAALASVERLEQDQVLRAYLGLIDATVRTSHYARTPDGAPLATLAMKLDCAVVPELPPPRPYVEAFVYSPRIEGLHLRGGRIARGGIRWSDRQDDLRTEVLGLVRAQVLKNAGIVPTGAKGGYVCRRLARSDSDEVDLAAEVRQCYQLFVSALLDITDNVVGGQVVAPPGVAPCDGEDPYLVVAADRGTATFSDLANEISATHGFWLGDAFASGGGHGYDHKAMGITARGAWEVARQHFRQLGIDPEAEEIRVIGVGDMSGDVFGNGLLRSRTIKLIAAFDHRHIFVDPDPDPARSFAERARLFALPRSSWGDYDPSVLSAGGGVWSRVTKEISLSPAARQVLGLAAPVVSPPELVSAILTASADMLWLGGIGTFVKAQVESHADVGDRANDAVRVDADQVRARLIVEGGNLGVTQRARIVYSRRGGKINADFIDNAAGVATSDYEVNLKILLALAIERGLLRPDERDSVLRAVQEDVAQAVLRDVALTALAVTRAVPASAVDLDAFEALMGHLEVVGRLDRKVESLPAPEDMAVRRAAGAGLTRPEAAVLLALAKSDLAGALEVSALVGDSAVHDAVAGYFPLPVASRFSSIVGSHRLYRELAATRVASDIVDRMGVTWAHETAEEFGVELAEVGRAFWAARHVLGADERWRATEALVPTISADVEAVLHFLVAAAVDTLARRYLVVGDASVYGDRAIVVALEAGAPTGDPASLVEMGVGRPDAESFARLPTLAQAADLGVIARSRAIAASEALGLLEAFDAGVGLSGFRAALDRLSMTSRWGRWQVRRLKDDLSELRRRAVLAATAAPPPALPGAAVPAPDAGVIVAGVPVAGVPVAWVPGAGVPVAGGAGPAGPAVAVWLARPAAAAAIARFQRLAAVLRDPEVDGHSVAALAVRALSDAVNGPSLR